MQDKDYIIIPLDTDNQEHVNFTYEILLKRYEVERINIDNSSLPSKQKHTKILKSNRYRYYYIGEYKGISFCTLYVVDRSYEIGFFLHPVYFKKILQNHRKDLINKINVIPGNISLGQKIAIFLIIKVFNIMLSKHPLLRKQLTAKISFTNKFSQTIANISGFKPIFITYKYEG